MTNAASLNGAAMERDDQHAIKEWYRTYLGIKPDADGYVAFSRGEGAPDNNAQPVVSCDDATNSEASANFMVNFRVDNLDGLLTRLRALGMNVVDRVDEHAWGRFGWVMDPDGVRIELWEPAADLSFD